MDDDRIQDFLEYAHRGWRYGDMQMSMEEFRTLIFYADGFMRVGKKLCDMPLWAVDSEVPKIIAMAREIKIEAAEGGILDA